MGFKLKDKLWAVMPASVNHGRTLSEFAHQDPNFRISVFSINVYLKILYILSPIF